MRPCVLIVDDEEVMQILLTHVLRAAGYHDLMTAAIASFQELTRQVVSHASPLAPGRQDTVSVSYAYNELTSSIARGFKGAEISAYMSSSMRCPARDAGALCGGR